VGAAFLRFTPTGAIPDHERLGAMLTRTLRMAALLPFFQVVDPAGGGGSETPPATPPVGPDDKPLGEDGEKALKAERDARKEADRRARAAEKELADLRDAAAKRADEEAAEQGKWQELATTREAALKDTTTERDSLRERVATLEALAADRLAALLKDLPKEIADLGPSDDTLIEARLSWAEKAVKAAGKVSESPGNRPGPKPAGNTRPDVKGVLPRRQYIN
jgi:hypothetical protein